VSPRTLLELRDLRLAFTLYEGVARVLDGVDLAIAPGERVGIVGESGCGKSVTARAALGLVTQRNAALAGDVLWKGESLVRAGAQRWGALRGREMSMIFQDPSVALNPVFTIADQMFEVVRRGGKVTRRDEALDLARAALARVFIDDPDRVLRSYPFQLSGGMAQRVMITMAMINGPELVIADEPGTALDVTVQEQTLRLMAALTRESGAAVILIAHNLGVIRQFCTRVYVMYAGTVAEEGPVGEVFREPLHPYTRALFAAVPRLSGGGLPQPIDGVVPDYTRAPPGCRFSTRCPHATAACSREPPWVEVSPGRRVRCVLHSPASAPAHA